MALVYVVSIVHAVPYLLFFDYASCTQCRQIVNSYVFRGDPTWFSFVDWNRWVGAVLLGLTVRFVVLVTRKLLRSPRGAWRTMALLIAAAIIGAATFGTRQLAFVMAEYDWLTTLDRVEMVVSLAVPLALAAGLLATRRARGTVGDLAVELEHVEPGGVRDALSRALGDPSLELALWLPVRRGWVDEGGRAYELPASPERSVTFVGEGDQRVAAIVHDPRSPTAGLLGKVSPSYSRGLLEPRIVEATEGGGASGDRTTVPATSARSPSYSSCSSRASTKEEGGAPGRRRAGASGRGARPAGVRPRDSPGDLERPRAAGRGAYARGPVSDSGRRPRCRGAAPPLRSRRPPTSRSPKGSRTSRSTRRPATHG